MDRLFNVHGWLDIVHRDTWTDGNMYVWTDGKMKGWSNGQMDGQTDDWTNGQHKVFHTCSNV